MIEGIIQIGSALLKEGDLLSNLIKEVEPTRKGKQLHVLKFDFRTEERRLEIDANEEMDNNSSKKYLFIGSADGSNSPQWYTTATSSNYHLAETIFNLTRINLGHDLNEKTKCILENYYVNLGEEVKGKYRYILDLKKFGISNKSVQEIYDEVKNEEKKEKKLMDRIKKEFEDYLKEKLDINLNLIGLYTILIDSKPIALKDEYKEAVLESKKPKEKAKRKESKEKKLCHICGSNENVTEDLSKIKIKYYTTNQIIFASELNKKNYGKNMQLCSQCLNELLSGENYISNNLSTKLSVFDVYIIPHFVYGIPLNKNELDFVVERINKSFNMSKNLGSVDSLRDEIQETLDLKEDEGYFLLNFMFYRANQKATKIQRLIKDVNPSVFMKIAAASFETRGDFKEILGSKFRGSIDLRSVYFMTPVRLKDGDATQYKDVLSLYDAVLTSMPLDKKHIIKNLIDCINIIRLNKVPYNINQLKESIEFCTLKGNMFIKFLEYIGCLKEVEGLDVNELKVKEDIKKYISKIGYSEQQTAMFLLGYLIGEVGNAQYKRADGQKPILNKLNFNGIDKAKIKRLANDVYSKLIQEKIRSFNEVTYQEMKRLIDLNLSNWKLNKDENLFYILSGYSFATAQPMLREEKKDEQ